MKLKSKNMRVRKKAAKRLPFDLSYTQSRELSWLQFNARVLSEAADKRVPLYERLKFAAIFSSNLDEFYMVRVGSLTGLLPDSAPDSTCGWTAGEQREHILEATGPLYDARDEAVGEIEEALEAYGFRRLRRKHLQGEERQWLGRYFEEQVRPLLSPLPLDESTPFPHLENGAFYVVVRMGEGDETQLFLVPVPAGLPLLVRLPGEGVRFVLAEQLVRDYAPQLFPGRKPAGRAIIRVTRSADISPDDGSVPDGESYRERVRQVLEQRPRLGAVRLEIQGKMKMPVVKQLCAGLGLSKDQVFWSRCPLSLGYVWQLADCLSGFPALFYPDFTPRVPAEFPAGQPVAALVQERGRLLHYPYESMEPFLRLLEESAHDPAVTSVCLTVYRVAKQSRVLSCLLEAARNGKAVTVAFELRARFDEQNNIDWAERLEAAGCRVVYGIPKIKCHAKLCLITRAVDGQTQYLTQIGTGNYNEKTAAQYTDLCLMTADPQIGADAAAVFDSLARGAADADCKVLLAAPAGIKPGLLRLIAGEADKARAGLPCGITFKCNSLTDRVMIDALQQAAAAGVPVRLLVRGICCLVPGIEGLTDRVQVFSIVGRFLEHARIYAFGADMETLLIGSSDLMTRNLDRRVEILCPVRDGGCAARVRGILQAQMADTSKRHALDHKKGYLPIRPPEGEAPFEAQAFFLREAQPPSGFPEISCNVSNENGNPNPNDH